MSDREPARGVSWRIVGAATLLVAIVALVLLLSRKSGTPVATAHAVRKDLVVSITSDGTLEPPPGGELRAPGPAVVGAILVVEGQRVARGAALVRLEDPELSQSALAARSDALALSEERARALAERDSARGEAEHLRSIAESDRRLVAQNAIARATLETDELAARQAEDRLRQSQARVDSLEGEAERRGAGPRGSGSGSRVAISAESARELERRVAALTFRAPTDGIVYGLPRKAGETIAAGQLVASVADPEHLRVRIRVDQPDLPRVAAGQRIRVSFDGLPDRRWDGHVLSVPTGIIESGGRQVGELIGEISDPDGTLPPNASVNVEILVAEKKGALTAPRAALQRDGARRFVFVPDGGRARRRDVTVGLIGLSDVEITSGLAEGDVVLLPGAVALADGMRVSLGRRN